MSDKQQGFVVCRQASDSLKPGYKLGYACAICKKALQVSPSGEERMLKQKLLMLCNRCGFEMVVRLEGAGKDTVMEFTPDFLRSFASYVEKGEVP